MNASAWLQIFDNYPDFLACLVGSAGGFAFGLIAEAYFIPQAWSERKQKGASVIVTLAAGVLMSSYIWHALDPSDPLSMRIAASFAASCLSIFLYPSAARVATKFFPTIGSVWAPPEKP